MTERDPLQDSREELARARQDLDALRARISSFFASEPFEIIDAFEVDPQGRNCLVGRIQSKPTPLGQLDPLRAWGQDARTIGIAIYASLNYLVYQLGELDQSGGLKPSDKGAVASFPISLSRRDFDRRQANLLRGVNRDHRTMIERLQPYNRGTFEAAVRDPLAVLKTITNPAKHSFPNAVVISDSVVKKNHFHITWEPEGSPPPEIQLKHAERYFVVEDGAEIYRMVVEGAPDVQVTVKRVTTDMSSEVAFGPRRVSFPRLEVVHRHVVEIIDSFGPVFKK